ncbi:MAG: helix-turn-helix domain-containing protein, partial [Streptosporangiaceae bacterium]
GGIGRVRPRRALCAGCGVSRVLLPDSMLRRRQYGVEVIWAGLLAAARGGPWNRVAAELGVPYTTVREWLRRFARRADRVHAWLCGLLPRLVDDPVWPPGTASAAGDALAVLGALHQQMPGRWPVVAGLSPGQLAARLSRCGLLAPSWPPGMINTSSPVT